VEDPARAALRARTRRLLQDLARIYPVVVVSSRTPRDLLDRLRGIELHDVLGSHELAPGAPSLRNRARVLQWRTRLEDALGEFPDVTIEDKGILLAVHFRSSRRKKAVVEAVRRAAASFGPHRWIRGNQVINLLPPGAPHKGVALERARRQFRCDTALYVGDDESDEDVFALDQPGELLGVRVGRRASSHAPYYVRDQTSVDDLLHMLTRLRRRNGKASP
jgi:trehalose 6-phosphate phosphatase